MDSPHKPESIADTFGGMYVGAMIALVMYGITTLQAYFYFLYYPEDGRTMKGLVAGIWLVDTVHVILVCHTMHYYLITNYFHPAGLADGNWSLFASIGLNVIMAFIAQSYFTRRIHNICRPNIRWWVSPVIAFVVFAHLCFGIETVVEFFIKKSFDRLHDVAFKAALPFAIFAILSDVLIAAALCILLHNEKTDFGDTNHLINKLIIYAINRCLLTSIVAIVEVFVFIALPTSLYTFAFDFVIGKLYTNSFLASLNSRHSLRKNDEKGTRQVVSTNFRLASVTTSSTDANVVLESTLSSGDDRLGMSDVETGYPHTGIGTRKIRRTRSMDSMKV